MINLWASHSCRLSCKEVASKTWSLGLIPAVKTKPLNLESSENLGFKATVRNKWVKPPTPRNEFEVVLAELIICALCIQQEAQQRCMTLQPQLHFRYMLRDVGPCTFGVTHVAKKTLMSSQNWSSKKKLIWYSQSIVVWTPTHATQHRRPGNRWLAVTWKATKRYRARVC